MRALISPSAQIVSEELVEWMSAWDELEACLQSSEDAYAWSKARRIEREAFFCWLACGNLSGKERASAAAAAARSGPDRPNSLLREFKLALRSNGGVTEMELIMGSLP